MAEYKRKPVAHLYVSEETHAKVKEYVAKSGINKKRFVEIAINNEIKRREADARVL